MRPAAGYSVIELMVVLALLGILAMAVTPLAQTIRQRERERDLHHALWELREAIDAYKNACDQLALAGRGGIPVSGYPASLQALMEGLPDKEAPAGIRRFLRKLPRDPFAPAQLAPDKTWRLRSYASDPQHPQPGEDVYDVSSGATTVALDGSPLSAW